MTDLLKDMMTDRADLLGAPDLDVLAMVREGNRRARRRTGLLGAGAAAAMAAAVAIPSVLPESPQRADEPAFAAAFTAGAPSFAIGSVVHVDGKSFDAGHEVQTMVQTTVGVVFTDDDGAVFATSGGRAEQIGQMDVASESFGFLDSDGSLAAWIAHPDGNAPVFTVHDQATGETHTTDYVVRGGASEYSPAIWAVDGGDVWLRDDRGLVTWTVATDQLSWRSGSAVRGLEIHDVSAGVVAHSTRGESTVRFGDADAGGVKSSMLRVQDLSLNGTTAVGYVDGRRPALADTRTGEVSLVDVPEGYVYFLGFRWVDSDTFVMVGLDEPGTTGVADLLTCEVGLDCTVIGSSIGSFGEGLVIPTGGPMTFF